MSSFGGFGQDDPYNILGVSKTATSDEIRKAFLMKSLQTHPDKTSSDGEKFRKVKEAYEALYTTVKEMEEREQHERAERERAERIAAAIQTKEFGALEKDELVSVIDSLLHKEAVANDEAVRAHWPQN
jgi:curved DNA-binding protein CbpA